jgi:hypothetical protein
MCKFWYLEEILSPSIDPGLIYLKAENQVVSAGLHNSFIDAQKAISRFGCYIMLCL